MLAEAPRTVLVSDVTKDIDADQLELYFENRARSGGGPVQQVVMHGTHAVVTFVDSHGISIHAAQTLQLHARFVGQHDSMHSSKPN